MGTRGLTAVVLDGQYKIAQYGQWDHYPSGQGLNVLDFCRKWLNDPAKLSQFVSNLAGCRFTTDEDDAQAKAFAESIGSKDGWMTLEQAEKWKARYPLWTRDHGANILNIIAEPPAGVELLLKNEIEFAGDSLFCEYAYVIDLDEGAFEVYKGFNKAPVPEGERFADIERQAEGPWAKEYYPIRLLAKFQLDNLPNKKAFLEVCEKQEEGDDE